MRFPRTDGSMSFSLRAVPERHFPAAPLPGESPGDQTQRSAWMSSHRDEGEDLAHSRLQGGLVRYLPPDSVAPIALTEWGKGRVPGSPPYNQHADDKPGPIR